MSARCAALVAVALFGATTTPTGALAAVLAGATRPTFATVPLPTTVESPLLLDWKPCDASLVAVQCAPLSVPLSYDHPSGTSITVTLARRVAHGPKRRIGALFVNPGGPGASAIDLVRDLPLPDALTEVFDIVGVEPRGTERATPVRCEGSALKGTTISAVTAASYAHSCGQLSGRLLAFIDSDAMAGDVDAARAALGEPTISMLTYSYGSRLAMAYRRRFSGHLRAVVMDGPVDPDQPALAGHIAALETTLAAFLHDCDRAGSGGAAPATGGPGCVLARRGAEPTLEAAEARFARGPLPATGVGHTTIDRATFETVMVTLLAAGNFRSLAQVINDTASGSTTWLTSAAAVLGVDAGSFRPPGNADVGAFEAYLCRDPQRPDKGPPPSRHFGAYSARRYGAQRCRAWPVPHLPTIDATLARRTLTAGTGLATVIVATTYDVRSSLRWAEALATDLGAPLIRFNAAGHAIVGQGNACIDAQVTAFLITPSTPLLSGDC